MLTNTAESKADGGKRDLITWWSCLYKTMGSSSVTEELQLGHQFIQWIIWETWLSFFPAAQTIYLVLMEVKRDGCCLIYNSYFRSEFANYPLELLIYGQFNCWGNAPFQHDLELLFHPYSNTMIMDYCRLVPDIIAVIVLNELFSLSQNFSPCWKAFSSNSTCQQVGAKKIE